MEMIGVEGVSRAAVIGVARAVLFENVVGAVVEAAEAECRSLVVTLGGVVEHNVENDFDARAMQGFDHVAKFVDRAEPILTRAVCLMRRKERDRRIAPVVDVPRRTILRHRIETPEEVRRRSRSSSLKVGNLLDHSSIRATDLLGNAGTRVASEPSHVHFVNNGLRRWPPERGVAFPVVRAGINDHAFHRGCGVAVFSLRSVAICSSSERLLHGRRDRAALCWNQIACRWRGREVRALDSRRFDLAAGRARTRASSGRCGWYTGSIGITRTGRGSSSWSNSSNSTPDAAREYTLKLTPP